MMDLNSLFCKHKWEEKERQIMVKIAPNGNPREILAIILRCIKCGNLKVVYIY